MASSSSSDNDSYLGDHEEEDDLVMMAKNMLELKDKDPSKIGHGSALPMPFGHVIKGTSRPGNEILQVDDLQDGAPRRPHYEQQNMQTDFAINMQS